MALLEDFKARFPEFDEAVADSLVPALEPVLEIYYCGSLEVAREKEILLNLLAHLIILEDGGKSASMKDIASKSVGSVSVSYATPDANGDLQAFFGSTRYGQKFLFLTSSAIGVSFV